MKAFVDCVTKKQVLLLLPNGSYTIIPRELLTTVRAGDLIEVSVEVVVGEDGEVEGALVSSSARGAHRQGPEVHS